MQTTYKINNKIMKEAGLRKVASVYDKVYITDSYKDWSNVENLPSNISVIKLEY